MGRTPTARGHWLGPRGRLRRRCGAHRRALELDAGAEYTKTELSDASGVAYKTLYLDGTVEALVDAGFLEREQREDEETTFRIAPESAVFEVATAFDEAATDR